MSERPTPETDAEVIICHGIPDGFNPPERSYTSSKFARRLERERDEAREDLEFRRGLYKVQEECLDRAKRERDEWAAMCGRYKQERDELLNEIKRLRLDAQREAEHHDRMVKELEGLYDKLKS